MKFTTFVTQKGQATIPALIRERVVDFLSLKGSIKTNKPFDLNAMEKAVEADILNKYVKKSS